MKRVHFFALRDDLLTMLEIIENGGRLKYVRSGQYPLGGVLNIFSAGREIPNLGRATNCNAIGSDTFVVSEPQVVITPRPIAVTEHVAVDQLWNPDTVTFTPAGIYNEEIVLYGRVAT